MSVAAQADFDGVLLLLGRLNYVWSNTESLLIHLIAGLAGTSKEVALVIYLTLNTTRARADLVERLARMEGRGAAERARVLEAMARLTRLGGLRNRYNHCIYAFDPENGQPRTIQMRIADRKSGLLMGRAQPIDAEAVAEIRGCIGELTRLNRAIWALIREEGYPG